MVVEAIQQTTPINIQPRKGFLSADVLKLIAISAMLIDHIAWLFLPTDSALGIICHVLGRLTIPIMCYFIAEGFFYTKSKWKYALRLGIFVVIAHLPYFFFCLQSFDITWQGFLSSLLSTSVMLPLLLGLIALIVIHTKNMNSVLKIVVVVALGLLSILGDWSWYAFLWIIGFSVFRGKKKLQMIFFASIAAVFVLMQTLPPLINGDSNWVVNLFQLGLFLAIPLLMMHSSLPKPRRALKWSFYVFYPLHLLILVLIKVLI